MVYRTFPFRLYTILEDSSSDEEECSVISWMPDGKNFKIHDLEAFKLRILPKYLPKQSKYKSFKRQLQYYGFTNHGSNMYGHPSFMRDEKSLLSQIEHRAFKKAAKMEAASALAAASTSSKPSSNSADRVSKAIKTPTDDAGIAFNLARAAESAPFESTASLSRDPLSSAFSTHSMFPNQSALHNRLLLSLTGRLPSQGFGFVASASQAADDAALLSSLSQSSSYNSNKVGGDNNGLLSSLLSSQLPSSLMALPSTLLALELEYQRQMRQQQEAASAVRARLLLSLSSNPSTEQQQQQQQRQESIGRLALLNGLGSSLQQQHEV